MTKPIHLQPLKEQTSNEFIRSLKLFIARRGLPQTIDSDHAKTFTAAASCIKKVAKNETVHNFLAHQEIKWKFSLSRTPWWGGQFERLIGLTKNTMYKTIGSSMLTWNEFEEVLLDIELTLNNCPLIYVCTKDRGMYKSARKMHGPDGHQGI